MSKRHPVTRGLTWIGVGVAAIGLGYVIDRPLVLRGTDVPWGAVVIGLGVVLLIWDLVKARRRQKPE